jgi:hypothetical protein
VKKEHKTLLQSVKKLDDDVRGIERQLSLITGQKVRFSQLIDELTLENDMTYQDLNKIVKTKEEVLV